MGASASSARATKSDFPNNLTLQFLVEVPLFKCLPKECFPELGSCAQNVTFNEGQVIIKQGDLGEEFFVIKSGTATVTADGAGIAELKSGDYFGEAALLNQEPRTATVTASTKIEALKITQAKFRQLGLHEKLEFPKREKLSKRHKMMAAGSAGVIQKGVDASQEAEKKYRQSQYAAKESEKKSFCAGQCSALKEIVTDKLNISAFFFVPLGQYCKYSEQSPGVIFFSNFCAIVPLASILGQSTEALANHTGQLIGGLLNATFGNAVEMIMCIQAVKAGLISVVQGNLLGSILSNLLLVLGMAIVASGMARKSQDFNAQGAAANMTCQLVASISVCLPTCFAYVAGSTDQDVLEISRICSMFLMTVYGMFLFFMLKTHADLFADEEEEEHDEDVLSPSVACVLLLTCTLVVFFCSECLVDSIDEVSHDYGLSKDFIGVILLPIVGNAAEHATAVTCAYKGMMDLALGVAVGSSTQIALFVVPCAVIAGYFYESPMNLNFTVFDTTCQMLTVFLVSQVLQHGSTNWLHGAMLMTVYTFIAVMTLYMHGSGENAAPVASLRM
jgi:Ca2+:H+ antiporter